MHQSCSRTVPTRFLQMLLVAVVLLIGTLPVQAQNTEPGSTREQTEEEAIKGPTSKREDVQKFWGYDSSNLMRYLTIPYDMVMNINVRMYFVGLNLLLLLFIPLVYFRKEGPPWMQLLALLLCLVWLILVIPSAYVNFKNLEAAEAPAKLQEERAQASADPLLQLGFIVRQGLVNIYPGIDRVLTRLSPDRDRLAYPVVFGLFFLLFFLIQNRIGHLSQAWQAFIWLMYLYIMTWLILSSGIPWYGLLMIPVLLLIWLRGVVGANPFEGKVPWGRVGLTLSFAALTFWMAFTYRFSNYSPGQDFNWPLLLPVVEYQTGRIDEDRSFDKVYLGYKRAIEEINGNPTAQVYRIGTFMPFFIEKNDRRIYSDNFLDNFQQLYNRYPDREKLARGLKAYGYDYLIINLQVASFDNTPEQSLRQKFDKFMEFAVGNPQLELMSTDRILRRMSDGSMYLGIYPAEGEEVLNAGSMAVFRIL